MNGFLFGFSAKIGMILAEMALGCAVLLGILAFFLISFLIGEARKINKARGSK